MKSDVRCRCCHILAVIMRVISHLYSVCGQLTVFTKLWCLFVYERFCWIKYEAKDVFTNNISSLSFASRISKSNDAGTYMSLLFVCPSLFICGYNLGFYKMNSSQLCHHHKFPDCFLSSNDLPYINIETNNILASNHKAPRNFDRDAYIISTCNFSASILFIILGLYTGCVMSNKHGRRDILVVSTVPHTIGWLCILLFDALRAPALFFVGQTINSYGVGLSMITALIYSVEICSRTSISLVPALFSISAITGLLFAWTIHIQLEPSTVAVLPDDAPYPTALPDAMELIPHSEAWVVLGMTGILIAIISLIATLSLPETPAWLVQIGKYDEAASSLKELRSELQNQQVELKVLKQEELSSEHITTDHWSVLRIFLECLKTQNSTHFSFTVALILLSHSSGINVIYSYFETSFEYNHSYRSFCTVTFCVVGSNIIMVSWILGHIFSHRVLFIASSIVTTIGCMFFTIYLYLGLEKLKANLYAFYILEFIFVGQCIAASQLIPIFKYVALVPSRLHPYAAFTTLLLAVLAFYIISLAKPHLDCYMLFTYFSLANIILLLVVCSR